MPAGDGTGPMGMGAMTGRGAGYCAGADVPGYANPRPGYGAGMGMGRGAVGGGFGAARRGRRNRFLAMGRPDIIFRIPDATRADGVGATSGTGPERERQSLQRQAEALQSQVDRIRKRLADLENTASPE